MLKFSLLFFKVLVIFFPSASGTWSFVSKFERNKISYIITHLYTFFAVKDWAGVSVAVNAVIQRIFQCDPEVYWSVVSSIVV